MAIMIATDLEFGSLSAGGAALGDAAAGIQLFASGSTRNTSGRQALNAMSPRRNVPALQSDGVGEIEL